ncbi:hypothetical protein [Streptomyces sp. NPDC001717]|uniref:hypothetical protein n=1 Tax=Streptomyces sp. NPDC001717 TaxID=3364604 RepID=UPI00368DCAC1
MNDTEQTRAPGTTEPELPAKVPATAAALTPDLPPPTPPAPDLPGAAGAGLGEGGEDAGGSGELGDPSRTVDGRQSDDPAPQEPTA